jgi:hypothetical protein
MDRGIRTSIAIGEGRKFKQRLLLEATLGQGTLLVILAVMAYFDAPIKSIVVIGLFLVSSIIIGIMTECALRLDAGRSYLEMWSNDAEDTLGRIEDKVRSISPSLI